MQVTPLANVVYLGRAAPIQLPAIYHGAQGAAPAVVKHHDAPPPPKTVKTGTTAGPPAGKEPASSTLTPGQIAMKLAMNRDVNKLLADLQRMRKESDGSFGDDVGLSELGAFAHCMAQSLGISEDDARLLTDAMSRGGYDAQALAAGVNALRTMSAAERARWLAGWLATAKSAAQAIIRIDEDPAMKSLGADEEVAGKLGDFAAANELMLGRNTPPPKNGTREQSAARARDAVIQRVSSSHGAGYLLSQAAAIGQGDDDINKALRDDFAHDFAARYGLSEDDAFKLIDAMRNKTQVGRMIADGLDKVEHLGPAEKQAFLVSFLRTALAATTAEAGILSDAFQRGFGAVNESDVKPIGDLADFIAALVQMQKNRATQALAV